MAEKKEAVALVRYQVLKKCFVNGALIDPDVPIPLGAERAKDGKVYVMAVPGLEGKGPSPALKLAGPAGKQEKQQEPPPQS